MKFWLLTHERELLRKTNTGVCTLNIASIAATQVTWKRKEPNKALLAVIESEATAVLYPSDKAEILSPEASHTIEHLIILDGTWQETQKMMNQSPYLHTLPHVKITTDQPSIYTLRRNQRDNGLCTAECIAEILNIQNEPDNASNVIDRLKQLQGDE